ncbi:unnamed protein product [Phaedon cochleariae]|uniref:Uncharacterized protein n=1 Tax=Phaedon cochleariae TaxID=80249 RepID=A0A9N9X6U5_PHACE|nr:unnamed protein product [Phaedon cochleariae]
MCRRDRDRDPGQGHLRPSQCKLFIIFAAFIAVSRAGLIGAPLATTYAAQPIAVAKTVVSDEYDPHPQYSYGYDVQDALTGDSKSQVESRDGDVVHGSYSLTDADGLRRTVDYTADPINGFNAVVRREPLAAKAVVAAPVVAKVAAPLAYAAPVARYAAPVSHLAYSAPGHVAYSAPGHLAYSAPGHLAYSAPGHLAYSAPGHLAYSAPGHLAYSAAPAHLSYAAPSLRIGSPLAYSTSVLH